MNIWLIVLVFLVGACLGVLIGMFVALTRLLRRLEAMQSELVDLLREAADDTRELDAERRRHLDATSTVAVDQMWQVGRALAREVRRVNRDGVGTGVGTR